MAIRPLTSTLTVELNQILTHPDPIDHQNLTCDRNTESERGWETWYLMIFAVTQCVCVCVPSRCEEKHGDETWKPIDNLKTAYL